MKRLKKFSRVCWASEANLCQVQIFRSEDCPSEVGREAPDHPQAKVSNSNIVVSVGWPASSVRSSKVGSYPNPLSHKDVSHIPQIQWRTPLELNLKFECHVAAGEESEEVEVQNDRETRVREAVYPHFSSIPPSPLISSDVEDEHFDDCHTPVIPVIGIEEAAEMNLPYDKTAALKIFTNSQPVKLPQSPSPSEILDVPQSKLLLSPEPFSSEKYDHSRLQVLGGPMVAAAAAATAIMKSKEPRSLIDPELLIKLLSNPKMTQKLINERGLASNTTTGTYGSNMVESSVPHPSSKPSFLIKKYTNESCKPANPGTEAIHRPSRVKYPPAAPIDTGPTSALKEVAQSVHFLSSTPVSLVQKSTSEDIQPGNAGNEALLGPGKQPLAASAEIRTGLGPKQVTTSNSLPSAMSDLPSQKSFNKHCQTADAGNISVLKASHTLSSSTLDVLSKKSTGKHIQLVDNGLVAVQRPVKRAPATSTETGTGSRSKTAGPLVPLSSSNPDFPSKKFINDHSQLANIRDVSVQRLVKPTLAGSFRAGKSFGPKQVTPSVPLPSVLPDFSKKSAREHGPLLDTSFPKPMIEKQPHSFPIMLAESIVDQLDSVYGAPHLGTSPLYQSLAIPKSVLAVESHPEVSRLKKLIDEHGSHNRAGNEHVAGIPAPPKPYVENMKKLIKEYGSHDNLENSMPGSKHPSFPLATQLSGMVEPLRSNFKSTEILPTASCASPFSLTTSPVSLPKDINYLKSLLKQHGEEKDSQEDELSQYGIPHNYLQSKQSDQKFKKPCKFYNSSKGCRNGSSCPFQHDMPERWRSGIVLEAPGAKRMKLGGEFTGRT